MIITLVGRALKICLGALVVIVPLKEVQLKVEQPSLLEKLGNLLWILPIGGSCIVLVKRPCKGYGSFLPLGLVCDPHLVRFVPSICLAKRFVCSFGLFAWRLKICFEVRIC